eukprot:3298455-Pleurochrysis_carterae.AAC.7
MQHACTYLCARNEDGTRISVKALGGIRNHGRIPQNDSRSDQYSIASCGAYTRNSERSRDSFARSHTGEAGYSASIRASVI